MMTKFKLFILACMLGFSTMAQAEIVRIEFTIVKMQSLTDQYKVRKILSTLDGIQKVILNDGDDDVVLTFDNESSSLFDIKTALAAQGYPATDIVNQ
ncbi:MAG: hypothetical protein OCD03_00610 [Hyphomicrobiales bacterium]